MKEEELIKKSFCENCKKNNEDKNICFKFYTETTGKIKSYGCANYETTKPKREDYFFNGKRAILKGERKGRPYVETEEKEEEK